MADQVTREEFDALVRAVQESRDITVKVHDVLATFSTLYYVAKWVTAMAAAIVVVVKGGDTAVTWLRSR